MLYAKTIALCAKCAADCPAAYIARPAGMWLATDCAVHGRIEEKVENDCRLFLDGYEREYHKDVDHLVLPLTYRCNLRCKYCYSLSNCGPALPPDRPEAELATYFKDFSGNITLIGGEPTLRPDLMRLIRLAKEAQIGRRVSIATNGQKLSDPGFVRRLFESGLDFVFLSLNDPDYEGSPAVRAKKMEALENCAKLGVPVWLQQTVDQLGQLDSIGDVLDKYTDAVFKVTIRAVRSIGFKYPGTELFLSDILAYLGKENSFSPGVSPFNRHIRLNGKKTKVCSWVNDMTRLDPIDSRYLISDGRLTTFHRGIKLDELLLKANVLTKTGT